MVPITSLPHFENNDRVRNISLESVPSPLMEKFAEAMQGTFPELIDLVLSYYGIETVLPETFLGVYDPARWTTFHFQH